VSRQRRLLQETVARTVSAKVVAQRRKTSSAQAVGQSREEATFLAGDATTVDQDHRPIGRTIGENERAAKVQAVKGAHRRAWEWHSRLLLVGCPTMIAATLPSGIR
jgi:hypothetical protein